MSIPKRKSYSDAQNVALTSQVGGVCPLCTEPLFYKKTGKSYKNYDIAHIYPLNPSPEEIELLKNEERLSDDVNDENNVIPLCSTCHAKFDKPRTVEEYRSLAKVKKHYIDRSGQAELWKIYHLEEELSKVIEALYIEETFDPPPKLNYIPHAIEQKTDSSISKPTVRKIRNNVADYYTFIRDRIAVLDKSNDDFSQVISLQIKVYYLKQKQMEFDQQAIFDNIVKWICMKTNPRSSDAAEILASFFVQNCEIFE
jgi:hypothetical protein